MDEVIVNKALSRFGNIPPGEYCLVDIFPTKTREAKVAGKLIRGYGLLLYFDSFDGSTPVVLEAVSRSGMLVEAAPLRSLRKLVKLFKETGEVGLCVESRSENTVSWRPLRPLERARLLSRMKHSMAIKRNKKEKQDHGAEVR